jgi:hypothetical protein
MHAIIYYNYLNYKKYVTENFATVIILISQPNVLIKSGVIILSAKCSLVLFSFSEGLLASGPFCLGEEVSKLASNFFSPGGSLNCQSLFNSLGLHW